MAAKLSSMRKRKPGGIMSCLSSAACEWFLMLLLFVDAVFWYLLREFAKYCELQTPCHLCSRLDHVLGEDKLGCSWRLVCSSHKKEISSLVFCSLHSEIADSRGMCEECLKSIPMHNNSECELLVGKYWVDVERFLGSRTCSCCNKTWLAAMSDDKSLLELKPAGLGGYKANAEPPMLHVPGRRRFSRRDGMKRLRDKLAASVRHRRTRKNSVGTLSRVGYTEFELSSGSEPEKPLPEDGGGDGNSSSIGDIHRRLERGVEHGIKDHLGMPVSNVISEKQRHQESEGEDRRFSLDLDEVKTVDPSLSDATIGHASRELCLVESRPKGSLGWTKDVNSLDCVPRPLDVGSSDDSAESSSVSSDCVCIVPSASSTLRITKKSIYIEETRERVSTSESMNVAEARAETCSDDTTCSSHSYRRTLTGTLCHCAEEDTKRTSLASSSEPGFLLEDAGPGPHNEHEESRKDEDCSYESLDGFRVDDVAGESMVDFLRRQVEHGRGSIKSLYEELEEERKAADIAVDQAMAMITRLQEEKAEVVMAAAQCIRLMELQAEFDMESLEREILSKKDKELQDLQNELEFYRRNFWDGSGLEDLREETSVIEDDAATCDSESAKYWSRRDPMSSSASEKLGVSHTLNKLVKNLYKDYCSENVGDKPNGLGFHPNLDMLDFEHDGSHVSNGNSGHCYELELHERLNALESAPDSIKCSSNLLRNGEDGLPLVHNAAHQPQKLKE